LSSKNHLTTNTEAATIVSTQHSRRTDDPLPLAALVGLGNIAMSLLRYVKKKHFLGSNVGNAPDSNIFMVLVIVKHKFM
jgi:hypothetical protein